jgi:hypothetical protein
VIKYENSYIKQYGKTNSPNMFNNTPNKSGLNNKQISVQGYESNDKIMLHLVTSNYSLSTYEVIESLVNPKITRSIACQTTICNLQNQNVGYHASMSIFGTGVSVVTQQSYLDAIGTDPIKKQNSPIQMRNN